MSRSKPNLMASVTFNRELEYLSDMCTIIYVICFFMILSNTLDNAGRIQIGRYSCGSVNHADFGIGKTFAFFHCDGN